MRVVTLRHHDEDDPGFIGESLRNRGATLVTIDAASGDRLPDPTEADGVLVLGAKWSVRDRASMAWMDEELAWLREIDLRGVPVFGICFGAQALSVALGGDVERSPRLEIGWTMVEPGSAGEIEPGPWLEFHEDRCLPPAQAQILATNDVGIQAFKLRGHLAVQFHPEVDGALLKRWLDAGGDQDAERHGLDPAAFLSDTFRAEPAARARAARLVGAARRLAAQGR
jgi:GMP synthase-like glutamine amidotransferase